MRIALPTLALAATLAGCSSMPSMPSMDFFNSAPQALTLRLESEPQGAEAKTAGGQSCRTPCAIAVPATDQNVTFSLSGFQPQTVPVQVQASGEIRGDNVTGTAQPDFSPNPVFAELQAAAPPPPARKKPAPAPRKPRPAPAAQAAPPAMAGSASAPAQTFAPAPWPAPAR